jgi:hypothetical protein
MRKLIILSLIIFAFGKLYCEKGEDKNKFNYTLGLQIGGAFPIKSYDFIEFYKSNLNKENKGSSPRTLFGLNYKMELKELYRLGILIDFYKYNYYDYFNETIQTYNGLKTKNFTENFDIQYIPVLFSIEIIPYKSQFRSFIGAGIGFSYSKITWNENVTPIIYGDVRTGGNQFSNENYNFTTKVYCGIDLGFDKNRKYYFLNSLSFEFYTYLINNSESIFSSLRKQLPKKELNFDDKIAIIPILFGVSVGVLINTNGL